MKYSDWSGSKLPCAVDTKCGFGMPSERGIEVVGSIKVNEQIMKREGEEMTDHSSRNQPKDLRLTSYRYKRYQEAVLYCLWSAAQ